MEPNTEVGCAVVVCAAAFAATGVTTGVLIPLLQRKGVIDIPNQRSSHCSPTPRGGGIGILVGILVGSWVASRLGMRTPGIHFWIACLMVSVSGLWDDLSGGLPVGLRLSIQLMAAGLVTYNTGGLTQLALPSPFNIPLGHLSVPLAIIWIVATLNLFNFLDGIDGYAAVQGSVAGVAIALLHFGDVSTAVGLSIAGGCGGFLLYNWHPAKVFMGDVGSVTLGLLLAALPFETSQADSSLAVFLVAMSLWFFLSDGLFTLLKRLSRGDRFWTPHKSHLYQQLAACGWRHDRVVGWLGIPMVALAGLALVATKRGLAVFQWLVLTAALLTFVAYAAIVRRQSAKARSQHFVTIPKT